MIQNPKLNAIKKDEFIGKEIVVLTSKNKSNEGIIGRIIDETYHTLKLYKKGVEKTLFKKNITFQIKQNDVNYKISGDEIEFRPEDRIKKVKH